MFYPVVSFTVFFKSCKKKYWVDFSLLSIFPSLSLLPPSLSLFLFVQPLSLISFLSACHPPSLLFLPASCCCSGPPGYYSSPSDKEMDGAAEKKRKEKTNDSHELLCPRTTLPPTITFYQSTSPLSCLPPIPEGVFMVSGVPVLSNGHSHCTLNNLNDNGLLSDSRSNAGSPPAASPVLFLLQGSGSLLRVLC